ncbi:stress-response A/B barrel domain-containing protein HS1 isoform X3 [Vigna angularis]|uniref:stress-response A/B barrel domain-containing protein HS1 isoform X3 n=1 Tax=Phaseolus angularis TaxID=3914 RepID=UPI0022B5AA38|nr:stress-response A/B barrel domain-containing protein HS1 isoform X3 [Vigna angularis]
MEETKGVVKHLLLAKFKDDVTPEKIEELIKGYANLVNLIPPMKAFHCNFIKIGLPSIADEKAMILMNRGQRCECGKPASRLHSCV